MALAEVLAYGLASTLMDLLQKAIEQPFDLTFWDEQQMCVVACEMSRMR